MREAGLLVHDCSFSKRTFLRYIIGFFKFLRYKDRSDVIFVGFLGQFLVPIVKLFTRKPIVFDAFVSIYQTLAFDRKVIPPTGLLAKCARLVDRFSCQLADKVILDTEEHINFFVREYNLDRGKFFRIFVGSDDSVMYPRPDQGSKEFLVHFHGELQPLHGAEYIVEAARLLPDVSFQMIGGGKQLRECQQKIKKYNLRNITLIKPVPYEQLSDYIAKASICLGIFGDTSKSRMVIPHKAYEALALAKPLITGDTKAIRELLTHKDNVFLCAMGNPRELVESIKLLKDDIALRQKIAKGGFEIFRECCRPAVLGRQVLEGIQTLLKETA